MKKKVYLAVLFLIAVAAASAIGSTLLWRLLIFLALLLLFSFIWVRISRGLDLQAKQVPERFQVGDSIDEEFVLRNSSRLPKFLLRLDEDTDIPGHTHSEIFSLPSNGRSSWKSKVLCTRRGRYSLGSATVTISDLFGFFSRKVRLGKPQDVLICPATMDLPNFDPSAFRGLDYGATQLTGQLSPNVSSVREYNTGDYLKHVHWGSTAHVGKLMVKLFDPDRSRSAIKYVWIALDMQSVMHSGEGEHSTEETGVTITASLIKKYIDDGCNVGLAASADTRYLFTPDCSHKHLWDTLTALALIKANGSVPVEQLISQDSIRLDNDSVLVVVTPSGGDRLAAHLRQIASSGRCLVVAVLLESGSPGESKTGNIARMLVSGGVQVHTIRPGDNIAAALNSRRPYYYN